MKACANIDEYIAAFPADVQAQLQTIRRSVHETVPAAKEKISYGIATFTYQGNLVHFAGYKTHIGFYPGAAPIEEFKKELGGYKISKGTVQFPLDKPLPLELIRKMTLAAVERNLDRAKS